MNYLISGGGTGGHIFPAISIANAICKQDPRANILFIGAKGRMEMERVPQAGYNIIGLPVRGFDRKHLWRNISVLCDLLKSMRQAKRIIRDFRPNVGVGVGGYASGAAMKVAARMGIPILLQEQNGFAGVTNKMLCNDAAVICVAYQGMERFFPERKIILTGNPVRQNLEGGDRTEAAQHFHLRSDKKTLLIIGGSLGARTINDTIISALPALQKADIQVIWQTGKTYFPKCKQAADALQADWLLCTDFLTRMDLAYALADVVISRAGASSISELCLLGKPAILVPSPNVAEDHQTHNAMALVEKDAAILVKDSMAQQQLVPAALALIKNEQRLQSLHTNCLALAQRNSAERIATEVIKLAKQYRNPSAKPH